MEMNGQLHALTILPVGKDLWYPPDRRLIADSKLPLSYELCIWFKVDNEVQINCLLPLSLPYF
jgi:hypothetical protein